jgi:hypothetical protein
MLNAVGIREEEEAKATAYGCGDDFNKTSQEYKRRTTSLDR